MSDILTEWQKEHAERLGALLGAVELTLTVFASVPEGLPEEQERALTRLAQAHAAYNEHALATEDAAAADSPES